MNASLNLLLARILLSAVFILAGISKLPDIAPTAGMIAGAGFPMPTALAWIAAIFEIVVGLFVLVGFQTKVSALLLAIFCLFTAFFFHFGPINIEAFPVEANAMLSQFNFIMMMKNIAMAGGFFALAAAGAGAWSVDARRGTATTVAA